MIDNYMGRYLPLIEDELKDLMAGTEIVSTYYGMMQYHMGWLDERLQPATGPHGKRLRPVLCLLACEAVGGQIDHAMPAAAAIELLHNFSLVHDDIEDNSYTRRHRATVWTLWGVPHAINCGDGMFATSFLKLTQLGERGVDPARALRAVQVFARTCLDLTEGQYLDMTFETDLNVDSERYLGMIRAKSAALIACSTRLGALLGGADEQVEAAYADFGENLGLAFQVIDDILGIWGKEEVTGKSAASDIITRKKTLPVVFALHNPELRALYTQDTLDERDVTRVLDILEHMGAQEYAEQQAQRYSERAVQSLARAGAEHPARQAIGELTVELLRRQA